MNHYVHRFTRHLRKDAAVRIRSNGSAGLAVFALLAGACGSPGTHTAVLRLGYLSTLTHAPAVYGVATGAFGRALGSDVKLETTTFKAGPAAVEAMFGSSIDAAYIGPSPAINGYQKSGGHAVRVLAGATSGGAGLVVAPSITSPAELKGHKLATPQLGNTQDVALRSWLESKGLSTTTAGGGDVSILPEDNSLTLQSFEQKTIDGAWVPEPWTSRLVVEGGGRLLVDESSLWPAGRFATTLLVVRPAYLKAHRDVIGKLLAAHVQAIAAMRSDPGAKTTVASALQTLTGKALKPAVLDAAWARLTFTYDPVLTSMQTSASDAKRLGFLTTDDIGGIADLSLLNDVLRRAGKVPVA